MEQNDFAANLVAAMNDADVTPLELAARLEALEERVHPQTIQRWIEGENAPRMDTLAALARALNTTPNALLGFGCGDGAEAAEAEEDASNHPN